MNIKNKGFTLIELMITVAIVGILAAVAVPAYQDYTVRAQVTEGLILASGTKPKIAEYYAQQSKFPIHGAEIGFEAISGKYVRQVSLGTAGKIVSVFGEGSNSNIVGKNVALVPTEDVNGVLAWNCTTNANPKYIPSSCESVRNSAEDHLYLNDKPITYLNRYTQTADGGMMHGKVKLSYMSTDEDGKKFYLNPTTGKTITIDKYGTLHTTNVASTGFDDGYYWGDASFTSNENIRYTDAAGQSQLMRISRLVVPADSQYFSAGSEGKLTLQKLYDKETAVRTASLASDNVALNKAVEERAVAQAEMTAYLNKVRQDNGGEMPKDYPLALLLSEYNK